MSLGRGRRAVLLALLAALAASVSAPRAPAGGDLFGGVDENAVKWGHTELANAVARTLGLKAIGSRCHGKPAKPASRR